MNEKFRLAFRNSYLAAVLSIFALTANAQNLVPMPGPGRIIEAIKPIKALWIPYGYKTASYTNAVDTGRLSYENGKLWLRNDTGWAVIGMGDLSAYYTKLESDARFKAIEWLPTISDVTGLQAALDGKISTTEKAAVNGVATLDGNGKIPAAQIPALAITQTFVVASQAAMLALAAQEGDVAVRTDNNTSYILQAEPASTVGNWVALQTPSAEVDPVYTGSAAFGITSGMIANWNAAYSWGNHAAAGYASASRSILAGTGLTGGGNLTADRSLSIDAGYSGFSNYYTKTNLQTSGQAAVHAGNITNAPWLSSIPSLAQVAAAGNTTDRFLRVTGVNGVTGSGPGLELFYFDATSGSVLQSWDRTANAFKPMTIGSSITNHQGRLLVNGATDDGTAGLQVGGNGSFKNTSGIVGFELGSEPGLNRLVSGNADFSAWQPFGISSGGLLISNRTGARPPDDGVSAAQVNGRLRALDDSYFMHQGADNGIGIQPSLLYPNIQGQDYAGGIPKTINLQYYGGGVVVGNQTYDGSSGLQVAGNIRGAAVGIGVAPTVPLHINSTGSAARVTAQIGSGVSGESLLTMGLSGTANSYISSVTQGSGGGNLILQYSDPAVGGYGGRVGIGEGNPTSPLHVNGVVTADAVRSQSGGELLTYAQGAASGAIGHWTTQGLGIGGLPGGSHSERLLVAGNAVSTDAWIIDNPGSAVKGEFFDDGGSALGIRSLTNHPLRFYSNNTLRMTIAAGGSVGINTASPTATLDVDGSFKNSGFAELNGGLATFSLGSANIDGLRIRGALPDVGKVWTATDNAGNGSWQYTANAGAAYFNTNGTHAIPGNAITVVADGASDLGINLTLPSASGNAGRIITISRTNGNRFSVAGTGMNGRMAMAVCNGSTWVVNDIP